MWFLRLIGLRNNDIYLHENWIFRKHRRSPSHYGAIFSSHRK